MGYLEDKRRNGRLTPAEHDELLALINAALDAANEHTKALYFPSFHSPEEHAEDADDKAYRAVLVWLCAHTQPEAASTTEAPGTASTAGAGLEVSS